MHPKARARIVARILNEVGFAVIGGGIAGTIAVGLGRPVVVPVFITETFLIGVGLVRLGFLIDRL